MKGILFVVHTNQQFVVDATSRDNTARGLAQQVLSSMDSPTRLAPLIQMSLGFSMAIFLFCLHGLRVLWPKHFEGELPRHIDYRSNG